MYFNAIIYIYNIYILNKYIYIKTCRGDIIYRQIDDDKDNREI